MHDVVIKGGTVVDGTGASPKTADLAISDGRIVEMGRVGGRAKSVIDADGAIVTPGFVDVHTHYDGQATWDDEFEGSVTHGVTTAVMGNCGVGFAPVHPGEYDRLIDMMEGVEDIPGTALSVGMPWGEWESFRIPRTPRHPPLLARHRRAAPAFRAALLRDGRTGRERVRHDAR